MIWEFVESPNSKEFEDEFVIKEFWKFFVQDEVEDDDVNNFNVIGYIFGAQKSLQIEFLVNSEDFTGISEKNRKVSRRLLIPFPSIQVYVLPETQY